MEIILRLVCQDELAKYKKRNAESFFQFGAEAEYGKTDIHPGCQLA